MKASSKKVHALVLVSLLGAAVAAHADALPPPSAMSRYTLQASGNVSEVLWNAVSFQETKTITAGDGRCQIQEKTFTQNHAYLGLTNYIVCRSASGCYMHHPTCTLSVVGFMGEKDFLTLLQEEHPLPDTPGKAPNPGEAGRD